MWISRCWTMGSAATLMPIAATSNLPNGTGSQERGLRVKIALQRFVNSVHGHWIGPEIM
jgi:hypothetical protein